MTKRFCDTEIWNKAWFQDLPIKQKLLTKFIFDNCDCAGILEISWRLLKFYFDEEITKEDFEKIKQVKFINENTIFVEDFILFQCSIKSLTELNANNNAHKGILKRLEKYNLLQAPNVPLTSPSLGAHSGAQEKEKEEEKEKDISSSLVLSSSFDCVDQNFEKCFKIYRENCPNLLPLNFERRSKVILEELNQFLIEIDYDFEYFLGLCRRANDLKKIVDTRIDFRSMIRNHIGIMNGKYTQSSKKMDKTPYSTPEETSQKIKAMTDFEPSVMPDSFKKLGEKLRKGIP